MRSPESDLWNRHLASGLFRGDSWPRSGFPGCRSMRILVLHNIVNPHMTPVFEAMARTPDVDLTVAYFAEREADRRWSDGSAPGFRATVLPGRQLNLWLRWDTLSFHINPGLGGFLSEARPDVVVNAGWSSPTNWHAFLHCRLRGIPHVLWAGSTRNEPSWRRTMARLPVKYLVRHSDAWAAYGTTSAEYLQELGAAPERVIRAYHCIDNARFLARCLQTRERVPAERKALGFEGRKVVLFVGRMLARKGADHLIQALASLTRERQDLALLMIGDGPMRGPWQQQAETTLPGVPVRCLGDLPLDQLPLYYQMADVFVLPSMEEVWGLVVNEAALAGLPIVVSTSCGAAADLVEPGANGYRVPAADVPALGDAVARVLRDEATRLRMGEASRRIVERCTPEKLAAALVRAAELATGRP
jgi:glycosyltransferase involved in cell wall biosynthesis